MEKIEVKQEIIEYTVEKKKIKNCYISIKDGEVRVRVPMKTTSKKIEEMILKRADWILENVQKQKRKVSSAKQYVDGEIFKILGKEVILRISYEKIQKSKIKWKRAQLNVALPLELQGDEKKEVEKLVTAFYEKLAEKEVEKAMRKMSMKVGIAPNEYKIKNLKSTWGNCSITRNISINQKIVMYSKHAIEYVCLHEICHLEHMNHSKQFWQMVEKHMPDYKLAEQELKN